MSDSIHFRPMTEADLNAVLKIEYAALVTHGHAVFFWTALSPITAG